MAVEIPEQFTLSISSSVEEDYGIIYDESDDGNISSRDLYENVMYTINAAWDDLDTDQMSTLRSFLRNFRNSEILVKINTETYKCRITGFPKRSWSGGRLEKLSAVFRGKLVE